MKKAYLYDEKTKEFKSETTAQLDPLESKQQGTEIYLLPANATYDLPPQKEGYAAVWNGTSWDLVEDHRKEKYYLPEDKYGAPGREVKELGPLPDGATLTAPEQSFKEKKRNKLLQIDGWTASKITGGFISNASGEAVTYDSDKDTQITMQGIALNVNTEQFAEKYPTGCPVRGVKAGDTEKTVQYLTSLQVLQWCADLSMHIGSCKQQGWQKQAQAQAATTAAELDAIVLNG